MIPEDLASAVMSLHFENPSDGKLAMDALIWPERATGATVSWLAALVERNGVRFDEHNPCHTRPHQWPLLSLP